MLQTGDQAPLDIVVSNQEGKTASLQDWLGKYTVIYFYPKDDTPGCTKEACGIRDDWGQFEAMGVSVFGVSPDGAESHQKFINKFQLPFPLLCDPEHQLAEAFGAWGEKKNFGKTYHGTLRYTFILDAQGVVVKVYPKVKPEEHAQELLQDLKTLIS